MKIANTTAAFSLYATIVAVLLLFAFTLAHSSPAALLNADRQKKAQSAPPTPERYWAEAGQAGAVVHVNADTPSPFMIGYLNGECQLLVNDKVEREVGIALLADVVHEAGHCEAIKIGRQKPGEITREGEAFGDVFAIAWISVHRPDQVDEAFMYLMAQRKTSRRISSVYDTLFPLNLARTSLPVKTNPVDFTSELLK